MNQKHLDIPGMPPFNTTMVGVLKGVMDYYQIPVSDAAVFGGSGHAFLINIHNELCPSSPYCWKREPFLSVVRHLGIEMTNRGSFCATSPAADRSGLEAVLKQHLDGGSPCSFLNLENQLIIGYDDTGFTLALPWPDFDCPITPSRLSFGSWAEFGDSVFPIFFTFRKIAPTSEQETIVASLGYAVDVYRHPEKHANDAYGVGDDAYVNWIRAVQEGCGATHGSWWNGVVWSECRRMAGAYFDEIAARRRDLASTAQQIAGEYRQIGEMLTRVSDKALPVAEKVSLLQSARTHEARCIELVERLLPQV